jgi:hypothetical protein
LLLFRSIRWWNHNFSILPKILNQTLIENILKEFRNGRKVWPNCGRSVVEVWSKCGRIVVEVW